MGSKRDVRAIDIVSDLRSGKTNTQLMEKYRLSSKGLASIFKKLIDAHAVRTEELDGRIPLGEDTVDLEQRRLIPRCYPVLTLRIYDMGDLEAEYFVSDITEKGVQVEGINARISDEKSFVIRWQDHAQEFAITFDAVCRWIQEGPSQEECRAGFAIVSISERDSEAIRSLVDLLAFCEKQ
jgi:hypothetical protein